MQYIKSGNRDINRGLDWLFLFLLFFLGFSHQSRANTLLIGKNMVTITSAHYFTNEDSKSIPMSDWVPLPMSRVIGTAQLICYGTVDKVLDSTFVFKIKKKIKGSEAGDVIEVIKARPDPFAEVKPAPYQEGQCYLLFLMDSKSGSQKKIWKELDRGLADQMPVIDNWVYFNDRYFEGLPLEEHPVYGVEQNIQRFNYDSFVNAVEEYSKCFRWSMNADSRQYLPEKMCNDDQMAAYSKKSIIHSLLIKETKTFLTTK